MKPALQRGPLIRIPQTRMSGKHTPISGTSSLDALRISKAKFRIPNLPMGPLEHTGCSVVVSVEYRNAVNVRLCLIRLQ